MQTTGEPSSTTPDTARHSEPSALSSCGPVSSLVTPKSRLQALLPQADMQRLGRILHRRDKAAGDAAGSPERVEPPPQIITESRSTAAQKRSPTPRTLRTLPRRDTRSSSHSTSNNVSPTEPPSPSAAARAAASAAMGATTPRPLDATEQQLFRDFDRMAVTDGTRRVSGSVPTREAVATQQSSTNAIDRGVPTEQGSAPRRTSASNQTSRDVRPLDATTIHPIQPRSRQHSLAKKGSLTNLKSAQPNKRLPKSPSDKFEADIQADRLIRSDVNQPEVGGAPTQSKGPADLSGVVDLTNTEDTNLHKHWAPAVTHETITQNVHELRVEEITREMHTHDVYHRILPVIDFEILPARHFVPVEGGYVEISADEVPGGAGDSVQRLLQQALANVSSNAESVIPTRFSARTFQGTEGDYHEWTSEDGIKRSEQWWVHPPTMVNEAIEGAEVDFVHAKPRATSAAANVVGLSPLLAQQRGIKVQRQKVQTAIEVPLAGNIHPVTGFF